MTCTCESNESFLNGDVPAKTDGIVSSVTEYIILIDENDRFIENVMNYITLLRR